MKTIWKFELSVRTVQEINMPAGAQILTAQVQNQGIFLWALVDEVYSHTEIRKIEVLCTGSSEPDAIRRYLGTVQMSGGALVFHIFERT